MENCTDFKVSSLLRPKMSKRVNFSECEKQNNSDLRQRVRSHHCRQMDRQKNFKRKEYGLGGADTEVQCRGGSDQTDQKTIRSQLEKFEKQTQSTGCH